MPVNQKQYSHYYKAVPLEDKEDGTVGPVTHIDVYNVLEMWEMFLPAPAHALKKLLCAGQRGAKDYESDLRETIACLKRELELVEQRNFVQPEVAGETIPAPPLTDEEIEATVDRKLQEILGKQRAVVDAEFVE